MGLYAFFIEPAMLVTHVYSLISEETTESKIFKVIQVSDIQISETYTEKDMQKLVERINKLVPDIVVFTGDLFDNFAVYHPTKEVTALLADIKAPYGKFAVWGNRDYGGGAVREYEKIMEDAAFTVLKNSGVTVTLPNEERVFIGGLDDALFGEPDINKMLTDMDQEYQYKIILLHEPDIADLFENIPVDLILAGHSHGGQVRFFQYYPVSTGLAEKYKKGFYILNEENKTRLYVNSGIGTSHMPVRFMAPPEIAVFEIQW